MKRMLFCLMMVFSFCSQAQMASPSSNTKETTITPFFFECRQLYGMATFTAILEGVCGFNSGVNAKLLSKYEGMQCKSVVSEDIADDHAGRVEDSARMRYQAYGHDAFCEVNEKLYIDLMDE